MANKPNRSPGHDDKNPDVSWFHKVTLIVRILGLMTAVVKLIVDLLQD